MGYQILNKNIKINKNKDIGKVLYIVEGAKREILLIGHIFKEILGYDEIIAIDREGNERIKYISTKNENSKVFIINSEKSNVKSISNAEFIDSQVQVLKQYSDDFNYEDIPIYYIFDCDRANDSANIEQLINIYGNSREPAIGHEFDSIGGMLLLSYPSIESFVISNFEKEMFKFHERFNFNEQSLKEYIGNNKYDNHKMSIETLGNAFRELVESLDRIAISKINIDDISETNRSIFVYEKNYNNQYMLSLLLISFVDLGIIELNSI